MKNHSQSAAARTQAVYTSKTAAASNSIEAAHDAKHIASYSSDDSDALSRAMATPHRKTSTPWVKSTPTVNHHTTCGRHTDQYFFTGPSLADLARSLVKKSRD
ncbi:hypothetical protein CDD82_4388 [Ophiocordyceps australis]|uniref:Uncharacterized protein n=1 Tax=Ophiocordyceps australis TaxID=1399860 RepID=A0A2C5Z704_9HYPO|nr:hypothetical protein CDD82_4388 [Ophiocordyceps australis]